jgi:hypothetical protein
MLIKSELSPASAASLSSEIVGLMLDSILDLRFEVLALS